MNRWIPSFRVFPTGAFGLARHQPAAHCLLAGLVVALLACGAVHANPTGHSVASGTARFARPDANTLNVTTSSNAIINWQDFSIGSGDVTRFTQPSATSAVLNRVTGSDASSILGELLSNGRVFLVNPNGIVFGEDAVVDTAGLVASTLGITDANFLAGRYEFEAGANAGRIRNQGLIKSGADGVFLLAPSIENSGVIRTDGGDLVLAAGRTIKLTSLDLDGVQVEVQAPEDEVLNLGDLIAKRGAVGAFAGSIRNSGTVEANAVTVDDDGTIRLVAQGDITLESGGSIAAEGPSGGEIHIESESGTTWVSGDVSVRASEGEGGTIRLLGNRVSLDGATVDASGPTGGGEVLVGGDESGEGDIPTAESTYVSSDSTVSADALTNGDGGRVIVFAEGFANVQGRLSARGGPEGGDGGFVETSGLETFLIVHTPDTTAPNGDGGEWLIDPNDIEIVPGGGSVGVTTTSPFESTDDGAQIGIDLIIAALSGGQTVRVVTTESGGNGGIGIISLNAPLDIEATTGSNTLILDAHFAIEINRPISDSVGGAQLNLVLIAGDVEQLNLQNVSFNADVTLRGGSLTTGADYVHVQNGATVILDGVHWDENSRHVAIGSGIGEPGTLILRNGASIDATSWFNVGQVGGVGRLYITGGSDVTVARGIGIGDSQGSSEGTVVVADPNSVLITEGNVNVGADGTGELTVENGANLTARHIRIGSNAGSRGTVTVSGSGSTLTAAGTDNEIDVGLEGTGTLYVLDGGLVETLFFDVAHSGVGRAVISGVAADGTRSRVIVSPATGRYSGDFVDEAGYARVGRNAGSDGRLEILEGGLLRVLDGDGTFGPGLHVARNKGSVGELLVDGQGSAVEIIQNGPAGDYGPYVSLGRRGRGVITIRNGARLLVRGEQAIVEVSGDRLSQRFPDADTAPIFQASEVHILTGGEIEVSGDDALFVIGHAGPAADGTVNVTGSDSLLTLSGTGNAIVVGDGDGRGRLMVFDGGRVRYGELIVGVNGTTNLRVQEQVDDVVGETLPEEEEDDEDEESEETAGDGEGEDEDEEELSECPV